MFALALFMGCRPSSPSAPVPLSLADSAQVAARALDWLHHRRPGDTRSFHVAAYVRHRAGVTVRLEPAPRPDGRDVVDVGAMVCVMGTGEVAPMVLGMARYVPPPAACQDSTTS